MHDDHLVFAEFHPHRIVAIPKGLCPPAQGRRVAPALGMNYELSRELIFFRTASSILINGGQGRLKPSPGNFFVASTPGMLPDVFSYSSGKFDLEFATQSECGAFEQLQTYLRFVFGKETVER
jgi:hypothetical protein